MNKQNKSTAETSSKTKLNSQGSHSLVTFRLVTFKNQSSVTLLFVAAFVMSIFFFFSANARAQSYTENLAGNESINVTCDGRGFQIDRSSRTSVKLICLGSPGGNPPVEPTQPPVEPTQTPVEPTQPPIEPTQPPVEPTQPPVEPTQPPVEPTPPPVVGNPPERIIGSCGDTTGFTPLTDLGTGSYFGAQGGLYPGGSNDVPADYLTYAMNRVNNINGDDRFVMLSIGMSNTMREFEDFQQLASNTPGVNDNMIIINGAQTGQDSATIAQPSADLWSRIDSKLGQIRLNGDDVRVIWLKEAHARPEVTFPHDATQLQSELDAILNIIDDKFPNVEVIYLSSRIYAGYSDSDLNPEPFAYQSGFSVKWLIEEHMSDPAYDGPALLWGPYMWADGTTPRSDGLTWECSDYKNDYIHPSPTGELKVAEMLVDFFSTDETAVWFRNP
ncbi:MAG: hypothetical protein AAF490_08445 [Chloroflexota bacterium]